MARWQEWHSLRWRPVSTKAAPWRGHTCTSALLTKSLKRLFWNNFKTCSTPLTVLNEGTISSSQLVVLQLECVSELPGGLMKPQITGLLPQSFWSLNLGWSSGLVSDEFPGNADVAGPGPTLRITMLRHLFQGRVNLLKLSLVIKVWIKLGNSVVAKIVGNYNTH